MSFLDKKFGELFPTRTGTPTGTANERQMLDALGSSDGFRTRIQKDASTGMETMLRTKNGMPQFSNIPPTLVETNLPIFMDSGAIELNGMGTESPDRFNNGILHYGTNQRWYKELKKLLGTLWPKSMKCDPPDEYLPAKSFLVGVDAFGARDQDMLDLLYSKKVCAALAGPSMFCGKARLYAQAQYGRELQAWAWEFSFGGTYQLQSKVAPVILSTNSGIFVDTDHRHWLLDIDNAGVKITKLKRDSRVLPLVAIWKGMDQYDPDIDKVEAYILAHSLPDSSNSFWIAIPGNPGCDMFGYGWKFNWLGTKADIIRTDIIPTTVSEVKYRSTHYRVDFSRNTSTSIMDEKSRWSAELKVVEGPVEWKSGKWEQVIAYPSWGESVLEIFGGLWGPKFGDAPVYCFYKRSPDNLDELEVIRCSHTPLVSMLEYSRTSSPSAWGGQQAWSTYNWNGWDGQEGTIGMDGGSGEKRSRSERPSTAGFYSESSSAMLSTESYLYERSSVSEKDFGGFLGAPLNFDLTDYHYTFDENNWVYTEGTYPVDPMAYGYDGVPCITGGSVSGGVATDHGYASAHTVTQNIIITYTKEYYSGTHSEAGYILLVIPFFDAEAAYVWANKDTSRVETGRSGTRTFSGTSAFITDYHWNSQQGAGDPIDNYRRVYTGGDGSNIPNPTVWPADDTRSSTTHSVECNSLVTSTGVIPFTPSSSMAPFFAGEPNETVSQTWETRTSIQGACFGRGGNNLMGFELPAFPLPFLGWA